MTTRLKLGLGGFAIVAACVVACSAPGSSSSNGGGGSSGATSSGGSGSSGGASSSGAASGSGGTSSGGTTTNGAVALPFLVSDQFVPSGFMGDAPADFNAMTLSPDATKCDGRDPSAKGSCYTIHWTPAPLSGQKSAWVGVYWQYPANNWGAKAGKTIAPGATKVSFSAKGGAGGEAITFLVGGINVKGSSDPSLTHADSFTATTDVTLTTSWAHYEVPLSGDTYGAVLGGFGWSMTSSATDPVTFYVDDIQWE